MREDFTVNGLRRGAIARDFHKVTVTLSTGFHRRTDQSGVAYQLYESGKSKRTWKDAPYAQELFGSRVRQGPENE